MNKIRCTRLVLEIWCFTVYFSGKRRSLLHPNTALANTLITVCANPPPPPPWAIHNTP